MNESIRNLSLDLAATKKKLSNFDSRFDILEKKQESNAATQSSRFDKLEELLTNLTHAFKLH